MRAQGLEPLTIWLPPEVKAALLARAQETRQTPSELVTQALATPVTVPSTVPVTVDGTVTMFHTILAQLQALTEGLGLPPVTVTGTVTSAVRSTVTEDGTVTGTVLLPVPTYKGHEAKKYGLGELCPGHEFGTSGRSVRTRKDHVCRACILDAKKTAR